MVVWAVAAAAVGLSAWQAAFYVPWTSADNPSHLYTARVLRALLAGDEFYGSYYSLSGWPQSNVGATALMAALDALFAPQRCLAITSVIVFGSVLMSAAFALRSWGARWGESLAASAPASTGFLFLMGFNGFLLAFSLSLVWLAVFVKPRTGGPLLLAWATVGGIVIYLFHPLPALVTVAVVGTLVAAEWWSARRAGTGGVGPDLRLVGTLLPVLGLTVWEVAGARHGSVAGWSLWEQIRLAWLRVFEGRLLEGATYSPQGMVYLTLMFGAGVVSVITREGVREAWCTAARWHRALAVLAVAGWATAIGGVMQGGYVAERFGMYAYIALAGFVVPRLRGWTLAVWLALSVVPYAVMQEGMHREAVAQARFEYAELRDATHACPPRSRIAYVHLLSGEERGRSPLTNVEYGRHKVSLLAVEKSWLETSNYEGFSGQFAVDVADPERYMNARLAEHLTWTGRTGPLKALVADGSARPEWIIMRRPRLHGIPDCVGPCEGAEAIVASRYARVSESASGQYAMFRLRGEPPAR